MARRLRPLFSWDKVRGVFLMVAAAVCLTIVSAWAGSPRNMEPDPAWKSEVAEVTTTPIYVESSGSCGGNTPCYTTIQSAINAASSGAVIKIAKGPYNEDLILSSPKNLTLQGGWDASFTSRTSTSTINSMTISNREGTVTADYLAIETDFVPPSPPATP